MFNNVLLAVYMSYATSVSGWCESFVREEVWSEYSPSYNFIRHDRIQESISLLEKRKIVRISKVKAELISASVIGKFKYYYIARAAYIGTDYNFKNEFPNGTKISIELTARGVAYVRSYRLGSGENVFNVPVLIMSDKAIMDSSARCYIAS